MESIAFFLRWHSHSIVPALFTRNALVNKKLLEVRMQLQKSFSGWFFQPPFRVMNIHVITKGNE